MHWKRRLKNLPVQEYLESYLKAKCYQVACQRRKASPVQRAL